MCDKREAKRYMLAEAEEVETMTQLAENAANELDLYENFTTYPIKGWVFDLAAEVWEEFGKEV